MRQRACTPAKAATPARASRAAPAAGASSPAAIFGLAAFLGVLVSVGSSGAAAAMPGQAAAPAGGAPVAPAVGAGEPSQNGEVAGEGAGEAQQGGAGLRVYLDCAPCDLDYLRREVPFADFVPEAEVAEVEVRATARPSGPGTEYELEFIGRLGFLGVTDTHVYSSPAADTAEERRAGLAQVLRIGLLEYLVRTPAIEEIDISSAARDRRQMSVTATPEDDPWNFWVFRINANVRGGGESQRSNKNVFGSLSASRTTEEWKLRVSVNFRYNDRAFELSDGSELINVTRNYGLTAETVRSMGDHWGSALRFETSHSTFDNQDLTLTLAPGIEYNIYPYSESSRRQLTFRYEIGSSQFNYEERTLFGETSEFLVDGTLRVNYDVNQPWGSSGLAFEFANYMHDFSKYSADVFGNLDFRITRGLSLDINGNGEYVRDQLFLPAGGLSDAEVLLERRARATSFRYRFSVGLSYTFGSIYNTIVNPRFAGNRGGFDRRF